MVRMKPVCISEDLLIEILLHLPAKSLLRFKSVCKQWHSLISSRRFCFLHTLRCSTAGDGAFPAAVLLRRWDLDYYHLSLRKATPLTLPGYIIQSCNGLLLVRCYENAPGDYIICNLATGQCRTLDYVHNNDECLTLVFDPSVSPYYKLICVKAADFRDSPFCYQIVVFDSESSSWSVVVKNFTAPVDAHLQWVFLNCGVYWNNAVHWNRTSGGLVYFDIGKGKISLAPKGPWMHQTRYSGFTYFVMESGGHLHYIMTDGSQLSVYEMERDYSQWSFKYHIEYGGISFTSMDDKVIGIMRSPNENSEKSFMLFNVSGKLMVYNLIDASLHELTGDLGMEEFNMEQGPRDVHQFIETMAPV